MPVTNVAAVCRAAVVLGYLAALALVGRPDWTTAAVAAALAAVWALPAAARRAARALDAGGTAIDQVSSAMASMPSQMPKTKNSVAAP